MFSGFCPLIIMSDQIFISWQERAYWNDASGTDEKCFVVATIEDNSESKAPLTIGDMSRKHIGIHLNGMVYNYGNKPDKVVKKTMAEFKSHHGKSTILFRADLP